MNIQKQISMWIRVLSLLLLSVLLLTIGEPVQAQGPPDRDASSLGDLNPIITPGPVASAMDLAEAMDIPAADLVSASIGASDPLGIGVEDTFLGAFFPVVGNSFAILSTGYAQSADDPDTNNGEILSGGGFDDDISATLDGLNNSNGTDLVQLTLVLTPPPGSTGLNFDFAFYSEEFPDWIGGDFNDSFIAELGAEPFSSGLAIVGNVINSPYNFAFDPNNDVISVNAAFGFDPTIPNPDTASTYDGTSGLLTATGCLPEDLPPDSNVVVILSITDMGDDILDSAVFLDNFQWGTQSDCTPGATEEEPTAVDLASFTIEANENQAVITWETATEIDNAGFNLYRALDSEGPWQKVNSVLIAAEGDPVTGATYTFVDTPGRDTFYYRLEDIDFYGVSTFHGPVLIQLGSPIRIPWYRPVLPHFLIE